MMNKTYAGLLSAAFILSSVSFTAFAEELPVSFIQTDEVTMELTATNLDPSWGYEWSFHLTNNTDMPLMFAVDNMEVNNSPFDPYWACSVDAQSETDSMWTWTNSDMALRDYADETAFTKVTFDYRVYNYDDYTDVIAEGTAEYCPYGEDAVVSFKRTPKESDVVILDSDQISITMLDYEMDEWNDFSINLYIENKGTSPLYIEQTSATFDDISTDPFWAYLLGGGKNSITNLISYSFNFEDAGVKEFSHASLGLSVSDSENGEEIAQPVIDLSFDSPIQLSADDSFDEAPSDDTEADVEPSDTNEPEVTSEPAQSVDSASNVAASGAEGKTWADLFK